MTRQRLLLTEREAAALIGFSRRWLQARRMAGAGPKFVQFGSQRTIRYRKEDLLLWAAEHLNDVQHSS